MDRAGLTDEDLGQAATEMAEGLVMIAKKRGLIAVARPVIALLKQHGMFLSESTIDRAMRLIDE